MSYIDNYNTESVIGEVKVEEKVKVNGVHYQLPNVSRAYGSEYYLTDVEMAILVQLGVNVTAFETSIVKTNVDMLNAELEIDKNVSRGRSTISEAIISLQQKGYIKVEFVGKNIESSPLLTVTILNDLNNTLVEVDGTKFTGFTAVTKDILKVAKEGKPVKFGQRLKVLTHIKWRNEINYSISFEEWKNVLNVVLSTAKSNIYKMEKDGSIEILHGEYKRNDDGTLYLAEDGRPRQDRNTYFLKGDKPVVAEGYRPSALGKVARAKAIEKAITTIMSEGEPRIIERPQLISKGSKLSVEDIEIFLTTESPTLDKMSREKFAKMMGGNDKQKRDNARQMLLSWEREVLELFKGGNEHKIKRSIFNLGNDKLSKSEQEMTPDELQKKVDIVGYDLDEEDNAYAYEINTDEEIKSIVDGIEIEEEKIPHYMTEEFRSKFADDNEEDETDYFYEQEQEDIDSLPFD